MQTLKIIAGIVLLFPWGFFALGAVAYVKARLSRPAAPMPPRKPAPQYIPPRTDPPMLLDSARLVKALRGEKQ